MAYLSLGWSLFSRRWSFWFYARQAPKLEDDKLNATVSSKLYDINNEIFEDLGAEKRELIQPNDVPQLLKDAIVSVEDRRFYKHIGVDPIRIIGSALSNVKNGGLQGGSTLTQQLIKLSYFSTKESDQTLKRKAQEAWMAVRLEREKSKEEILTYYINKVYMANGFMEWKQRLKIIMVNIYLNLIYHKRPYWQECHKRQTHMIPIQSQILLKNAGMLYFTQCTTIKNLESRVRKAKATPIDEGLVPLKASDDNRKVVDNYVKEVINEVKAKTGKMFTQTD